MCKVCECAKRVVNHKYGDYPERMNNVENDGFCYGCVQTIVNTLIGKPFFLSHCQHDISSYCSKARNIIGW